MKLISLNIENELHLTRVLPFLLKEQPDVICLQEVFERDLAALETELGMSSCYAPMVLFSTEAGVQRQGIAILTKHTLLDSRADYYALCDRAPGELVAHIDWSSVQRMLLSSRIEVSGKIFQIATTHFTWTPNGQVSDEQRIDLQKMLQHAHALDPIILCGDFNAPRGREIFSELASHYIDTIPPEVMTTIDQNLHKTAGLQYVVDGLFSSPEYTVSNVRVIDGISDHCAIIGDISRTA